MVMNPMPTSEPPHPSGSENEPWHVKVYIAGWTAASMAALSTVKALEAEYFPEGSVVEVIDLIEQPETGVRDNVLAIPTVVKVSPAPVRRIVGNLSNIPKTLKVLGFSDGA
jgi:circadian clock protein KaiB